MAVATEGSRNLIDVTGAPEIQTSMSAPPNNAPKRDKFAALAAQQAAPKRDKFASLQAQQQSEAAGSTAASATPQPLVAAPPRQDNVESLAAASQPQLNRDKFASMASAQAAEEGNPVRRDKFAAVQQQKKVEDVHKKKKLIADKCRQRDHVWKDLDAAEAAVTRLLHLAERTADTLAVQTGQAQSHDSLSTSLLMDIQSQYQQSVNNIHALLEPHAEHIKAYAAPTRVNRMYLQRVEHRLADSKLRLLQECMQGGDEQGVSVAPDAKAALPGKRKRI